MKTTDAAMLARRVVLLEQKVEVEPLATTKQFGDACEHYVIDGPRRSSPNALHEFAAAGAYLNSYYSNQRRDLLRPVMMADTARSAPVTGRGACTSFC
jgi:hypothetical protein